MKLSNITAGTVAVALMTTAGAFLNKQEEQLTNEIKSGEKVLFCNFDGSYKKVPAHKFKEFKEINGKSTFYFKNGYATNCYTEQGESKWTALKLKS